MIIGIPKEVKVHEYRVAITPEGVRELVAECHRVMVEEGAGAGSGFTDDEYMEAGAEVVERDRVFGAELIVKVKEPLPEDYDRFRKGQALFTFLHLAANRELADMLLEKKITGLAYETLEVKGKLPLLAPMSEIAGRMAPLMGAYFLQKVHGGSGVLPAGASGVNPAKCLILGAGNVGTNAAKVAVGLGMDTVVLNRSEEGRKRIEGLLPVVAKPLTDEVIREEVNEADVTVGAVLVPGAKAPILITRDMLGTMKRGSVIVDVSVDQGGCVETTRPTTHQDPVYEVDGILHYAVANMPGAYPRTSTQALTAATLPYIKTIVDMGIEEVIREDPMRSALNTYQGELTNRPLAEALGLKYREVK